MLLSSDLVCLQEAFSTLLGLFDWVGLRMNVGKMVVMGFHPCQTSFTQSEATYERWMTGAVLSYRERQKVRVQCLECGEYVELGLLVFHQQTQHGK